METSYSYYGLGSIGRTDIIRAYKGEESPQEVAGEMFARDHFNRACD